MTQGDRHALIRRVATTTRNVADSTVVVHPADGTVGLLGPTASLVWTLLRDWRSEAELDAALAGTYPSIPADERRAALHDILTSLDTDGLLDRQ